MSRPLIFLLLLCLFLFSEVCAKHIRKCWSNRQCPPRTCCYLRRYPGEWNFPLYTCVPDAGTNQACIFRGCPRCKLGLRCVCKGPWNRRYCRGYCQLPLYRRAEGK